MTKRGAFLDEFEIPNEKRIRSLANLQVFIFFYDFDLKGKF